MASWCPALQTRVHPEKAVIKKAEWKKELILSEKINFCPLVLYKDAENNFLSHI